MTQRQAPVPPPRPLARPAWRRRARRSPARRPQRRAVWMKSMPWRSPFDPPMRRHGAHSQASSMRGACQCMADAGFAPGQFPAGCAGRARRSRSSLARTTPTGQRRTLHPTRRRPRAKVRRLALRVQERVMSPRVFRPIVIACLVMASSACQPPRPGMQAAYVGPTAGPVGEQPAAYLGDLFSRERSGPCLQAPGVGVAFLLSAGEARAAARPRSRPGEHGDPPNYALACTGMSGIGPT